MAATIFDVAKLAGVSPSTVSRVFLNPYQVNSRTRISVLRVAEDVGYVPGRVSTSPTSGKTGLLGFVVPDLTNPFFPSVATAMLRFARRRGHMVLLADPDGHTDDEFSLAMTMSRQVDGLILWGPRYSPEQVEEIASLLPIVLINEEMSGHSTIACYGDDGVAQVVEHLAALGHLTCCYVRLQGMSWKPDRRAQAVARACEERSVHLIELGPYGSMFEAGAQATDIAVARGATAIIGQNDVVALGVMRQLTARGLSVPEDVSVVGVDDTILAATSTPMLTTVRIPVDQVAACAIDLILTKLRNPRAGKGSIISVPTQLIVRQSTATPPAVAAPTSS